MKKSGKVLFFTFALLIAAVLCGCAPAAQEVNFPDPNLEARIRDAIDKPTGTIYASDLASLTSLDAGYRKIADITGIEYCTNLTELWLSSNRITDITPLKELTNLKMLSLSRNDISDISPISQLTDLEELRLIGNHVSDITLLSDLINLEQLALRNNSISDISPLSDLNNLKWLCLGYNQISDIEPLVRNTGLNSSEDEVYLWGDNPLSNASINIYIPELQARGVWVHY